MVITIRPAQASDAVRWEQIHANGWEYAYRGIFDDEYLDAAKEKFRKNIDKTTAYLSGNNGINLVAINETGLVVGTMFGRLSVSESGEKAFELQGLYLDPEYIGCGAGKKLVHAFADWVKQNGVLIFGRAICAIHELILFMNCCSSGKILKHFCSSCDIMISE